MNDAQRAAYKRVGEWLTAAFDTHFVAFDDSAEYAVLIGPGIPKVSIIPWGDDVVIRVSSLVVTDCEVDANLTRYLLEENGMFILGAFSIDGRDVVLGHNLVGSCDDEETFVHAVRAIGDFAEEYGDRIIAVWGGRHQMG